MDYKQNDSSEETIASLKEKLAAMATERDLLLAENALLRQLYEQAPLGYQSLDENGFFLSVNQAWTDTLGYRREEVIGRNFSEFLHPDWRNHFRENFPRFKSLGEILGVEFEMVRKDGSIALVSFHGKIGKNPQGDFQRTHCIFQDITASRRMEEEYKHFFDLVPDMVCIASTDGYLNKINGEWQSALGYSEGELLAVPLLNFVHPGDREATLAEIASQIEGAYTTHFTNRYRHKDGSYRWFEWRASPANHNGLIFAVARDITERKLAEDALLRKDAMLRAMLRNLPFDFWARDTREQIIMQSDESVRLWGDLLLESQSDGEVDPQTVERWKTNNRRVLEGEIVSEHCTLVTKNGEKRKFHNVVAPIREGDEILGILGINIDISERIRTEEELRTSSELLSLFIKHSPIYAFIKEVNSTESRVLKASENFQEMIGVAGSQMSGKSMQELFPPEFAAKITADDWSVVSRGEILHVDEELNGRFYTTIKFPILLGGKNFLAGYTIDLTERKQAEEEKKALQQQLLQAQKIEAIGTLAGGIAHDFNNILGAIIGYTEMAKEHCPAGSKIGYNLDRVLEAGGRAINLVKQILAFSRKANANNCIPMKPKHLIKEAIKLLRPALPSTITITLDLDTATQSICSDPNQFHQIVMNLCTNAFHAMEQTGGVLGISLKDCELEPQDLLHHPIVKAGRFVVLSIADSGPGIAPEIQDKIFDPYFTTKEVGKGTGLGLSIVHGIATTSGGFVTCESELGTGTVFRVFFPGTEEQLTVPIAPVDRDLSGRERILLIDDEEILVEMGKVMLERLGYKVTIRTSSLEALSTFQEQPNEFDAVITDQTMPSMTGIDLARKMLQIRPNIPIILCTGHSSLVNEAQARACGVKELAMKPFTKNGLAALLRKVLDDNSTL